MAITITIDNDPTISGPQTLIEDESSGTQTPSTTDSGNDIDVTLSAGLLGGFATAFNNYLNGLGLSTAQKSFAATNDGASSSSSFVTVTTSAGETISNLMFSESSGAALDGDVVAGMHTLDGGNVYLWSSGDFCIATTSATAGAGRIVAAFYLNEAANHLSAQVQMVTFEPLQHPVTTDPDDALNFTDVLQVSAQGTLSFNFDNLPSGSFLYAAVGNSSAGLLVTGQDLNVTPTGTKAGNMITGGTDPSDTVNTSQGGIGATIGINSQHFTDQSGGGGSKVDGAVGVFTLVKGFTSYDATINGTSEGTGGNVNEIGYSDYVNAPSAKIFISQVTGSSSIGGAVRVTLWEAGGGSSADHLTSQLKPEEGLTDTANSYSYIGDTGTDSHLTDDTPVLVGAVTVQRGGNTYTFTGSGSTQAGITVAISSNGFTITGLVTSDTIGFSAANDPNNALDGTFNRFDVQALANSNPVDIGRIDLDQGVSISHGVGSSLIVQDDGPSIIANPANAPSITDDESVLGTNNTGDFSGNFTPTFGSDGAGATSRSYALSTPGGDSGVIDTATGLHVFLFKVGDNIVGKAGTDAANAQSGSIVVFVVSTDQNGVVTLDQQRAIVHANPDDSDESRGLTGSNLVVLTATAYDGDGDHAAAPLDITGLLNFKDDGPSIVVNGNPQPSITDDESALGVNNSANYSGDFTPTFGNDGAGATPRSYALSTPGGDSGVIDTATGLHVFLFKVGDNIVGKAGTDAANALAGSTVVFVVSTDQNGVVTLDQQRAIVHANPNDPDESRGLTGSNLVVLTATAYDGDGDHASAPLDLTGLLNFKDDGPTMTANPTGAPSITDDESLLGTNNTGDYSGNFTAVFGNDGAGATPRSYSLSTAGGDCGLIESGTGLHVFLFKVGDNLVGKSGTDATAAATGTTVFVVSINQSGVVTLDQQRAVVHNPNSGVDQSTTLSSAGLVVVNATAFDGDGDHAADSLNIGQLLNFKDDAPTITAQILGGSVAFAADATGTLSHSLNGAVGADINSSTSQSLSGVMQYTITSFDEPTSVYPNLDGVLSADGTSVTYYSDATHTLAVYQLTLNQTAGSGAGSYTFSVLQPPPIVNNHFDFTDLPSGQNLFGIIATDKAHLDKGGLLVFASNPDLAADGTMTNLSGTINTSKGGGPVTIGNGNQAFDNPGEGAYFMYVDNPVGAAVGGVGLTQTSADDADTIAFNGVNQARSASVSIVQASGSGTAKRPGPAMHITAYEANPGNVDNNPVNEARTLVNNPTLAAANQGTAAPEVDIVGIKIHDATGAVIEYRTVNQAAGANNIGTLHGADSAVGIQFVLDNAGGTGTGDDIYSAVVSNLVAGYTVEFITATDHDLALVQNVSGSYDIGGFNVANQANIAAQDFHFSAQINDYDNDAYGGSAVTFANWTVHVNDITFT
ncbi:MAG TPA: DUF5801 repeats-in-toxin domain-containing protein [Sphingomicrobium sp.]|nr:DUF5801 repeats-in-toxin domain-containing protein [Sphingomicrobium sp.]